MSQQGADDWWQKLYEGPDAGAEPDPGDTLDNRFRSAAGVTTDPAPAPAAAPRTAPTAAPATSPAPDLAPDPGPPKPPRAPDPLLPGMVFAANGALVVDGRVLG
ncbi:hypothetical protein AB0O33_16050, partial [Streptomyces sp. NPDC089795]